jgi:hypothetical protein
MIKKRAQVTIFIIVALLIVGGIIGFFAIKNKSSSIDSSVPATVLPIYNFIQDCLKETAENALYELGANGGDIYSVKRLPSGEVYYGSNDKFANLKEIELSLSAYINNNLNSCIEKLQSNLSGFVITNENLSVNTEIRSDNIKINFNQGSFFIEKEESKWELKDINSEFKTDFLNIYNISMELKNRYFENNGIDLTYLSNLENNEIKIFFNEYPDYVIITIFHEKGVANDLPYLFKFALK